MLRRSSSRSLSRSMFLAPSRIRRSEATMSLDQVMVLQHAEASGGMVNQGTLKEKLNWDKNRSTMALEKMLGAGLLWVDKQGEEGDMYWVPSIFTSQFEN